MNRQAWSAAIVIAALAAAAPAQAAARHEPGGRHFPAAAHFSAGASGDARERGGHHGGGGLPNGLVRVSDDTGITSSFIPPNQSGTVYLGSEVEPWLAVNPADPENMVGFFQEDRWSTGGARNLVFATTKDGGETWRNQGVPGITMVAGGAYERATDPWVDFGPGNRVYGFTLAFDDSTPRNALFVNTSKDGGRTWGPPVPVIVDTSIEFFNDKNAEAVDSGARSPFRGNVYLAWDRLDDTSTPQQDNYTGPAFFSRSTDGGASFSTPRVIFATGTNEQTIGNVPVVLPDGTLVVAGTFIDADGNQSIFVVRSRDGGVHWSAPKLVQDEPTYSIPNVRGGDTVPSFAVDRRTGRIYAAWEDSRPSVGARDDILVMSSDDGGRTWSDPVQANDTPPGAQSALTPAIQVDDKGRVGLVYYDLRADPSPSDGQQLTTEWFTSSRDGGRTFGKSKAVTPSFDMAAAPDAGGFFLGDYQALGTTGDAFQPFFVATLLKQADGSLGTDVFVSEVK
jgi:hypothetical protein